MSLHTCGGNQDWPGARSEVRVEAELPEKRLLEMEMEIPSRTTSAGLSPKEAAAVVDQAIDLGARRFILRGRSGPLGRGDILAILSRVRSRGAEAVLIPDTRLISGKLARDLAGLGVHVVLRWPETRGVPPTGLIHLLNAGYPGPDRALGVRIPMGRFDRARVERRWRWSRERGLIPSLERCWRGGPREARRGPVVSPRDLKALAERLAALDEREFGLAWGTRTFASLFGCDRFRYSLAVTAKGDISPCLGSGLKLGNVRETSIGRVLGEDPRLAELRNARTSIKGFCRTCEFAATCRGCRALALLWTGDRLASDPQCWEKAVPVGEVSAVDASRRLPHKGPMRFLRGTAQLDAKKAMLSMRLPRSGVFVARNGRLMPLAFIEMLAQLCAAQRAHDLHEKDGSRVRGYLVGIDHVQFRKSVSAGDQIRLIVWNTLEMNEINRVEGEVFRGAEMVARAELTLFKAEVWFPRAKAEEAESTNPPVSFRIPTRTGAYDPIGRGILRSLRRFHVGDDGAIRATLSFAPGFIGFKGHFPGHPVVPGVVLVYAGFLLAEMGIGRKLKLLSLKRAKFLKPVWPSVPIDLSVRISPREGESEIRAKVEIQLRGELTAKYEFGAEPKGRGRG